MPALCLDVMLFGDHFQYKYAILRAQKYRFGDKI